MCDDVAGFISITIFYMIILVIGIFAARKTGFGMKNQNMEDVMLANRSIGLFVGTFTMTATWVGGGYINGTTEVVAAGGGFVWCQAPFGYALSLIFGGVFFSDKMRGSSFTTMLDPFQWKYGDVMNCLLYLPAVCGDIFWSAAILAALGASLKVVLDMNLEMAIIFSAAIACGYTLVGGLYSVAYTDVIQLICMFFGLWLCVPFAMTHGAVEPITGNSSTIWLGKLSPRYIANYIDFGLLLICGGIPWQVFWQRVLAARTCQVARRLSYCGAVGCVIMAVPSVLMGAVAVSTNWANTDYGKAKISAEDRTLTLPLVMLHLCPPVVTFLGLGAVSAAVMSSTDSALLSSSSMFARNVFGVVYARIHKVKVSETTQVWVMRLAQIVITTLSCIISIRVSSIYGLWLICSDFVYVILYPQLVCVMYIKATNSYGSFVAFFLGLLLRLLGGDKLLGIPALIKYPWYEAGSNTQLFPYRTLSMLVSLSALIGVSFLTQFLFTRRMLPLCLDVYGCFQPVSHSQSGETPDKRTQSEDDIAHDTNVEMRSSNVDDRRSETFADADVATWLQK